ncbi:D-sedoheptulose 7-phosphate isomerase [Helicobacter saguini]|uniref:Phosphoheptose isomerase n=1 Tax=Helicobacter saguini TaxID=1548018 RepID=A0A347VPD2_9HELI|nr:D-sedoheptulose 7-phosphate isomerase [Helicobacter saguini]MWV61412.1 D-sedoheptulose 7-phosphate isomerase [Helicobacter saguini]MWV67918.1 D-sedoheptulose 7-phosphate isomerase [Helicobacter saguini]MWV70614.1 D-sedoheptulose 7-phosphate isomerase [Helicobacter saguini]MWV72519.1 D-sedoheptulose 7-phosphate isomerase [Helicobacter saguini]TLD94740.1 D-sedoheptulose 7-phosphate isomerase [Helicobacter saguini]
MSIALIKKEIENNIKATQIALDTLAPIINDVAKTIIKTLKEGKKILICGNGGSAADSQHFAAELTGRYKRERKGLKAISLTTDTSALTAIGNDYGYDVVFSRQAEALLDSGDILFGISTSGNSKNIINALECANKLGCITISLSGRDGGKMKSVCDYNIIAPSDDTPRIQEIHILCIHIICELVEKAFAENKD